MEHQYIIQGEHGYEFNDDGLVYWEYNDVEIYVDGGLFVEELRVGVRTFYLGNCVY